MNHWQDCKPISLFSSLGIKLDYLIHCDRKFLFFSFISYIYYFLSFFLEYTLEKCVFASVTIWELDITLKMKNGYIHHYCFEQFKVLFLSNCLSIIATWKECTVGYTAYLFYGLNISIQRHPSSWYDSFVGYFIDEKKTFTVSEQKKQSLYIMETAELIVITFTPKRFIRSLMLWNSLYGTCSLTFHS